MKKIKIMIASILFILAGMILSARGAEIRPIPAFELRQGEPAPVTGYLFSNDALIALINKLKEGETTEKRLAITQQELSLTKEQVEQLKEAVAKDMVDRALANQIIGNQKQERELFLEILNQYRLSNVELREDLKSARNEVFWTKVFSAIGPLAFIIYGIAHGF